MASPGHPGLWAGYWLDRLSPWSLAVAGIALAVGGAQLQWPWYRLVFGGVVPILVGVMIPALLEYWKRKGASIDEVAEARETLLEGKLYPLLERTADVATLGRSERKEAADRAADKAVNDLAWAFGTIPGVRAVVFVVSDDKDSMTPLYHAGRQQRPGDFVRGTARGDRAFQLLEEGVKPFVTVDDLSTAPGDWGGSGEGYSTFITAPIRSSKGLTFGLLTLDAEHAGSLDGRHGATLALFAAALGVLFAEAARSSGRGARLTEELEGG